MPKTTTKLAAIALTAATAAATTALGAPTTRAVIFHAFKASGAPAIHVTRISRGSCNGGSAAINRNDAWRCFAGNFVYDPCFSSARASGIVLCPDGPWSGSGVEIRLKAKLKGADRGRPSTDGQPWAVETTTGLKCQLSTGATTVLDGKRANYFCSKGRNILWGSPSRKSEPWTIYSAPGTAKKLTTTVALKLAWF